jgi:hypothetical protein
MFGRYSGYVFMIVCLKAHLMEAFAVLFQEQGLGRLQV